MTLALALVFMILAGLSHFLRDARLYQTYAAYSRLAFFALKHNDSFFGRWYHHSSMNQSFAPDFAHFFDSFMRWSVAGMSASFIFFAGPFAVFLVIVGLYLAEWLFTILYHSVNPLPGSPDYIPFTKVLCWLVMPWRKPS